MTTLTFWNGNKSTIRQKHELEILKAVTKACEPEFGHCQIINDTTDYPDAKDEGNIFNRGADLLVTVGGNKKFAENSFISVNQPLAKGILGKRILIIREEDQNTFKSINIQKLKKLRSGIPATWADAELFRYNGYNVVEKGLFEEVFTRLKNKECDYVSLGANEVESIYTDMAKPVGGLAIETTLMLTYPMPLVFYVHPNKPELAKKIATGLEKIQQNNQYEALFSKYYGECVRSLDLIQRNEIKLSALA